VIGEEHALLRDPVDVGCRNHHAVRISTDIGDADIVSHDHDDVGPGRQLGRRLLRRSLDRPLLREGKRRHGKHQRCGDRNRALHE
jgi:hypothetical protein